MRINWITIAAQIVNFLILVWLLRRFLFGPVMNAMERREQRIADRLAEADRIKAAAAAEGRAYQQQQAELEARAQAILGEAREVAERTKRDLLQAARSDADQRHREWLAQVEAQRREFLDDLRRRTGERFFTLARQVLRDMADADLEAHMVKVFLKHLATLGAEARRTLAEAAVESGRITVASCFELASAERAELTRGIHDAVTPRAAVEYTCDPARAFGVELRADSQVVQWTLDDYLNEMEHAVNEVLAVQAARQAGEGRGDESEGT